MSRINQIQQRIKSLGPAAFQKLIDDYLYRKGYGTIHSFGSVAGKDQVRKGTPDTFFILPSEKYVLVETTTKEDVDPKDLVKKLKEDIGKNANEKKLGIGSSKIEKLCLCYTSTLSVSESNELIEYSKEKSLNIDLIGIDTLANDILKNYPSIARDHLGLHLDTGQLLSLEDFVRRYSQNKLTVSLNTEFLFREAEINNILSELDCQDIVILSGKAGTGKTRLALECSSRYIKRNPSRKIFCVFNRDIDLSEDVISYLSEPGEYLLLLDDANRLRNLNYLLTLIGEKQDRNIKLILTVRDYAVDKISHHLWGYKSSKVEISQFNEEEIKGIIEKNFGIRNHHFHSRIYSRIYDISKGNARLAAMAAKVASEKNSLISIKNVTHLFDEYFESINQDLINFEDSKLINIAALVALLRTVHDISEIEGLVEKILGIKTRDFWNEVEKLDKLEIVDFYGEEDGVFNKAARISDQILGTYLFYLAVFKNRTLSFDAIFAETYFSNKRNRLLEVLNSVFDVFDFELISSVIKPSVIKAFKNAEKDGAQDSCIKLIDDFWFLNETTSFNFCRDLIKKLNPISIDESQLKIDRSGHLQSDSILHILSQLGHSKDESLRRATLKEVISYFDKRPRDISEVFRVLRETFGINRSSLHSNLDLPILAINALFERLNNNSCQSANAKMLVALLTYYLGFDFESLEPKDERKWIIYTYHAAPTEPLLNLRDLAWRRLFDLFIQGVEREEILNSLNIYSNTWFDKDKRAIVLRDGEIVLSAVSLALSHTQPFERYIANKLIRLFEDYGVEVNTSLKANFDHASKELFQLFTSHGLRRLRADSDDFDKKKQEFIFELTKAWRPEEFECLIDDHHHLAPFLLEERDAYLTSQGIADVLLSYCERDFDGFVEVLVDSLKKGGLLFIVPGFFIREIIRRRDLISTKKLIQKIDKQNAGWWLGFYSCLPGTEAFSEQMIHINLLCEYAKTSNFPSNLEFLLHYNSYRPEFALEILRTIYERASSGEIHGLVLYDVFNCREDTCPLTDYLVQHDLALLKNIYLFFLSIDKHIDYDQRVLSRILDIDADFIKEYLNHEILKSDKDVYWALRDISFDEIWQRDDYVKIVKKAIEAIFSVRARLYFLPQLLFVLALKDGNPRAEDIVERQTSLIANLINENRDNLEFLQFLFSSIRDLDEKRKLGFWSVFLKNNQNIEDFRRLPIDPSGHSGSGSLVPAFLQTRGFLISLLSLLPIDQFPEHRELVESHIHEYDNLIAKIKRDDLLREW